MFVKLEKRSEVHCCQKEGGVKQCDHHPFGKEWAEYGVRF